MDDRCDSPDQLHAFVREHLNINVPRQPVCAGHDAPFEYLQAVYFEPGRDVVVWAPRGGGKTRLAAAATLLDLIHKPGAQVRILGGSLEQSLRMWEHLLPDLERIVPNEMIDAQFARRIELSNGSAAAVLAQSERSVRGLRVQKLRCDEVEMFDPAIWQAAQLTTRSLTDAGGHLISGTVEAMSTMHQEWGLMNQVIQTARRQNIRIIKWCIMEVLEKCPPQRECATCPLWDDCGGVARIKCDGFFSIDDAISMKRRVSAETWQAEMLCRRPSTRGRVFGHFERGVHVRQTLDDATSFELSLAIDFGFANPFVCLWVRRYESGAVHVIDEYVQSERRVEEHLSEIESKSADHGMARVIACDPAGEGRNEQTAESNVHLLHRRGYKVRTRRSRIAEGIEHIRAALRPASGAATLFIHPRCERLIRALEAYHYPPLGGSELPHKDGVHDHPIDALRYFFVNCKAAAPAMVRGY